MAPYATVKETSVDEIQTGRLSSSPVSLPSSKSHSSSNNSKVAAAAAVVVAVVVVAAAAVVIVVAAGAVAVVAAAAAVGVGIVLVVIPVWCNRTHVCEDAHIFRPMQTAGQGQRHPLTAV